MNYLAFKVYLIKCPSISSNDDINILDNYLIGLIRYIYIFIYDIYIYNI